MRITPSSKNLPILEKVGGSLCPSGEKGTAASWALLLACKYDEVSVPVVEDLVLISDRAYCRKEVLDMEKLMLNSLQFNMSVPTPYVFMTRFLKAAKSDKKLDLLSFIIELCLVEYEMLCFPPSLLTAAAVSTAQCSLSGCKH